MKLTAAISGISKIQKAGVLITDDNEGETGDEKKNEGKPAFNCNEFLNSFPDSSTDQIVYFTLCNPHPEFLINFIGTHYPAVLTPPPNC